MIDKATVERIKDAADIVEVVSDYVHLTRRGANFMGLCPFHNEKTPSFSVSPRRNFCYCFSCHKGGSPVNFIMEKEGVSYHDALLHLAKKYGIKVEERELSDEEKRAATEREGLLIAAQRAMQIMEDDLTSSQQGRDIGLSYLYGRGITQEAIRKFHLGYAIDSGQHLTPMMQREGYDTDTLRTLGLTGLSQNGNLYDKYRGRVIFPIMNSSGKVVGFGGRDLKGGPAKYINSPESVLYRKNQELYGIFQAKAEIVRQNRCYLVEGYLDVISMWQSGLQNVVASSGTALTDGQIAMIHRFTENITLIYDGDAAGIKAALRGIDMLLSHKMQVSVLLLPDGHDPDSFARAHTPEEFREYVEKHSSDIIRFKMRVLMRDIGDSPQRKAEVINSVARSIACIPNDVQRTVYIGECSRELRIDEATVARAVEQARIEIVRQHQAERSRRQTEREYPDSQQTPGASAPAAPLSEAAPQSPAVPDAAAGNAVGSLARTIEVRRQRRDHPMKPLETNIIRYLVRYGYVALNIDDLTPIEGESDTTAPDDVGEILYTVADMANDEMHEHDLEIATPEYRKVFDVLLNHLDEYVERLDSFKARLDASLAAEREQRRMELPEKVNTMADIEREERRIEEALASRREKEIYDFSRNYPGDFLASHEDGDVRRVATELLNDPHVLSAMFTTPGAQDDSPKELAHKINRAVAEWRIELLNQRLHELSARLEQCQTSDAETTGTLQLQIVGLMRRRAEIAKECGERIISSR
ncbi:MAG: DNA primase [Muribaculaceae bacterium]|nr:DNA primase [Muribaculaceae bacterium]